MSSYQDYANAVSDILLKKGRAQAQGASVSRAAGILGQVADLIPSSDQLIARDYKRAQMDEMKSLAEQRRSEALDRAATVQQKAKVQQIMASGASPFEIQQQLMQVAPEKANEFKKLNADFIAKDLQGLTPETYEAFKQHAVAYGGPEAAAALPPKYPGDEWKRAQLLAHADLKTYLEQTKEKEAKAPEPFTLSPGQQRFGADGKPIAEMPYALTPDQVADNARADKQLGLSQQQLGISQGQLSLAQQREKREATKATDPKEATQQQILSAGYAKRVEQAEQTITDVEKNIAGMGLLSFAAQSRMPSKGQSGEFQQYDQAARNLINAVLRRESGAAISASEFDNARRQYLPQPGDTSETLALKKQNRQTTFESLKQAGGQAYTPTVKASPAAPPAPAKASAPTVGSTVTFQGKRYKVTGIKNGQAELEPAQ